MDDADRTPPLGTEGITSRMYRVAEEVVRRERAAEWRDCENEPGGPVCKVWRKIDELDGEAKMTSDFIARTRGERKRDMFWLKVIGVAMAIGTLGMGAVNWVKRDTTSDVQAEIRRDLQAIKAELAK